MPLSVVADAALYQTDETAWLETAAELIRRGRLTDVDPICLANYLSDMARRDRRETESRLIVLLTHVLKWFHQPEQRSRSWRATIIEQRQELEGLIGTGVLRTHAEAILPDAYRKAVERAAAETGLAPETFPAHCPYSLEQLLSADLLSDPTS